MVILTKSIFLHETVEGGSFLVDITMVVVRSCIFFKCELNAIKEVTILSTYEKVKSFSNIRNLARGMKRLCVFAFI